MATTLAAAPATRRPLFGGYALVAVAVGWVAGITLRASTPLVALRPLAWLSLLFPLLALTLGASIAIRRSFAPDAWLRLILASAVVMIALVLGGWRAAFADTSAAPDSIARLASNQSVMLRGTVSGEPDIRGGYRFLTVDVSSASVDRGKTWQAVSGSISATVYGSDDWFAPAYGDTVQVSGTLRPPGAGYMPPGTVARLTGARATVRARGGNPLLAALFALRLRLAEAIQRALPEPEAALLIGIFLGLKTPTLRARLPLFTSTGTIHLVVPAGLKVATLAELATAAGRPLGRTGRSLAGLLAVVAYAATGGGGAAAIRAAIMGILLALAPLLGRAYSIYTALALAALCMTALEPSLIFDAGFQLTVLATGGLPLLVPPIQRRLVRWLRWLPVAGGISELLAATLAAQIATLPVLVLTFHQLSLIAPLANLLTVPLLAPLLVLGAALAGAGALGLSLITTALAWLAWPLLWFANAVIAACAAVPLGSFTIPALPLTVPLAYYVALSVIVFWLMPRLRARRPQPVRTSGHGHTRLSRGAVAVVLVIAVLASFGAASPVLAGGTSRLDFLATGLEGTATLVRLPSGTTVLINGGADGPALESLLASRLPFWQRTLDLAILTGAQPANARGLEDAAAHFHIVRALDAGMRHPSAEYLVWLDAAKRSGAAHAIVRQNDSVALGEKLTLRVLSPPQGLYPDSGGASTASDNLVLRLEMPGLRVLLLGDADNYALDALAYSGQPLAADVVQVALPPDESLSLAGPLGSVLQQAHPRLIVVTPTPSKTPGVTPSASAVEGQDAAAVASLGAMVYRTTVAGTISLSGGAQGWAMG